MNLIDLLNSKRVWIKIFLYKFTALDYLIIEFKQSGKILNNYKFSKEKITQMLDSQNYSDLVKHIKKDKSKINYTMPLDIKIKKNSDELFKTVVPANELQIYIEQIVGHK